MGSTVRSRSPNILRVASVATSFCVVVQLSSACDDSAPTQWNGSGGQGGNAGAAGGEAGSAGHAGSASAAGHSGGSTGGGGGTSTGGGGGTGGAAPFSCAAEQTSPTLAAELLFDPAQPHPGDTLTVLVKTNNNTNQTSAPPLTLEAHSANGNSTQDCTFKSGANGGKDTIYYCAVANVGLGDVCVLAKANGNNEVSGKVVVTQRPSGPPLTDGVYRVTKNHQYTCAEQVPWGNELHITVLDAGGGGVANAQVTVHLPDTTDKSNIKNAAEHPVPTSVTTDASGHYDDFFWWPSNTNGLTVLDLWVEGKPSDIATEITSGWWDTDANGCKYCPGSDPINVYGHWSHSIEFRLDPSVTEACVVPTDHAGQSACGAPPHIYHDPNHQACWPVN